MKKQTFIIDGRSTTGWTGGEGPPILLLHGGWGGAEAHWSNVWQTLCKRYRVVAPELPGIAGAFESALSSYAEYAGFCVALCRTLHLPKVVAVGNSFGAIVAWELASRHPETVDRIVMVDGYPAKPIPGLVSWLMGIAQLRRIAKSKMVRSAYDPGVFPKAFSNPERIPSEIRRNLTAPEPGMIEVMFKLVTSVSVPAQAPLVPVDSLWGSEDRLDGATPEIGRKLQASTPGSRLIFIEKAGHLPQHDNPAGFLFGLYTLLGNPGQQTTEQII